MGPALIGVSVSQISLLINTIFASFLKTGSVSWLYYADRLMEFPSGMLGVALGTILLPSLAKYHASENHDEYSKLLDWGLRLTLLLAAPAALALALLAIPLITTLFYHGAFSTNDVFQTRSALAAYSVGLTGAVVGSVMYATESSSIVALDVDSGKLLWWADRTISPGKPSVPLSCSSASVRPSSPP